MKNLLLIIVAIGLFWSCQKNETNVTVEQIVEQAAKEVKTITVEEPGRNIAINKIVYELNHKFGLVHANIFMQDGSVVAAYLHSDNTNK